MHRILPILLVFTVLPSWAGANCQPVDLRPELGPPRDQGSTSWCFAHSAADLVTQRLGQRVSAMDLAVNDLLGDELRLTGSADPKIQRYLAGDPGFLERLHRWRDEVPDSYRSDKILTDNGLYYLGGMDQDTVLLSFERGYCAADRLPDSEADYAAYLKQIDRYAKAHCGPGGLLNCSYPSPARIGDVQDPNARSLAQLFQNWVDETCGTRILPREPILPATLDFAGDLAEYVEKLKKGELDRLQVQAALFAEIDRQLDNHQAVSIGFDSSDLTGVVDPSDPLSDHSSVIAARKFEGGRCLYFLRTHGGAVCGYLSHLEPQCEAREGGLWVGVEDLPSVYGIVYLR